MGALREARPAPPARCLARARAIRRPSRCSAPQSLCPRQRCSRDALGVDRIAEVVRRDRPARGRTHRQVRAISPASIGRRTASGGAGVALEGETMARPARPDGSRDPGRPVPLIGPDRGGLVHPRSTATTGPARDGAPSMVQPSGVGPTHEDASAAVTSRATWSGPRPSTAARASTAASGPTSAPRSAPIAARRRSNVWSWPIRAKSRQRPTSSVAAHSRSPDASACSIAVSMGPCSACHRAARRCRSGRSCGLSSRSLERRSSENRRWKRNHVPLSSSGTMNRLARSRSLSRTADPLISVTASQTDPSRRPRIDDRSRNARSSAGSPSRTSSLR